MTEKISILYVDDEDALRVLVPNQLNMEGFLVDTADDGDTAVEMVRKKTYDLILLDIRMPRMNGIDVLRYLRDQKFPARVIMLTAVDDLTVAMETPTRMTPNRAIGQICALNSRSDLVVAAR